MRRVLRVLPSPLRGGYAADQVQAASAGLPPGWEAAVSPEGHIYYCNRSAGTTQWNPPD